MIPISLLTPESLDDVARTLMRRPGKNLRAATTADGSVLYDYCMEHGVTKLATHKQVCRPCPWPVRRFLLTQATHAEIHRHALRSLPQTTWDSVCSCLNGQSEQYLPAIWGTYALRFLLAQDMWVHAYYWEWHLTNVRRINRYRLLLALQNHIPFVKFERP